MNVTAASGHILVVDDHRLLAETLQRLIGREGYRVDVAHSGVEGVQAVERAEGAGDPYTVVFTDFSMPDLDGLAVAAAIKRTAPSTVVILLTAYAQDEFVLPAHVDAVLPKPPTLAALRVAITTPSATSTPTPDDRGRPSS